MKRGFEHLNCAITSRTRRDETFLCFSLFRIRVSFFCCCCFSGNVTNIPAVLQPSSTCQWGRLLTVCCQRFTHQPIVFSLGLAMRSVSLFSSRAATLVSRVSRLGGSTLARACTPLTRLNLKKTRGCLQSTADPCSLPGISNFAITVFWSTSRHSFYYSMRNAYSDLIENKMGAVFPRIIAGGDYSREAIISNNVHWNGRALNILFYYAIK